jgi:predicted nucleotidyltransferase
MSQVNTSRIWQHNLVLPYILYELRNKIEVISPVRAIYLFGSRARMPATEWDVLEGKDWDILVVCDFKIINTSVWTRDLNYHIDLIVADRQKAAVLLQHTQKKIELYPQNQLVI